MSGEKSWKTYGFDPAFVNPVGQWRIVSEREWQREFLGQWVKEDEMENRLLRNDRAPTQGGLAMVNYDPRADTVEVVETNVYGGRPAPRVFIPLERAEVVLRTYRDENDALRQANARLRAELNTPMANDYKFRYVEPDPREELRQRNEAQSQLIKKLERTIQDIRETNSEEARLAHRARLAADERLKLEQEKNAQLTRQVERLNELVRVSPVLSGKLGIPQPCPDDAGLRAMVRREVGESAVAKVKGIERPAPMAISCQGDWEP